MAYYSPEEVATVLKVKSSTLRKYVLLLEDEGITYQKNEQGHRYYSDTDIIALQKFISFKNSGAMNLKESAKAVFLWSKSGDIAERDTSHTATTSDIERYDTLTQESLLTAVKQQQELIQAMSAKLDEQAEQNAVIMAELNATRDDIRQLIQSKSLDAPEQVIQPEKKSLWARIRNR